jgi:quaternary ammonium compound-resistance protein SugE
MTGHRASGEDDLPFSLIIRGDGPALSEGSVMAWAILFVAGLMEIGWAIGLKYTEGFSRPLPSVLTLACMAASVILLGLAVKTLPIGTAYAVWTGIGAVGTAVLGIILFGDPATALRLACIGLIVAGIAGLKLVT